MNPVQESLLGFQELVARVPEPVQPFVVMLGAAIPFVEGETAAGFGVVGGVHPVLAATAGILGNALAVLGVVIVSARARQAVLARRGHAVDAEPEKPESKGRQKFRRWVVRFGVPGASLLGPLAIPTHVTSALLVASGTPVRWVLLWQGIAIVVWTSVMTTLLWLAVTAVTG